MNERNEFLSSVDGRLDVVLSKEASISRSQASKAIRNGAVLVEDKVITQASLFVEKGVRIILLKKEEEKTFKAPPQEIEIQYAYKDKDLCVINKPRGLVVHPAPGHSDDTLVNQLFHQDEDFAFDQNNSVDIRPGIVHRIDKDTSGLLLVANNVETQAKLQEQVREKKLERSYIALVYGSIKDKKFRIDAPLTRPDHTVRKALVDPQKGREAITHCQLLARGKAVSLIRCVLETGRTHQIRAHLSYISHPIVGDLLYGHQDSRFKQEGQCLHAYSLSFIHPKTGKRITCYAPLDDYFKKLLRLFF